MNNLELFTAGQRILRSYNRMIIGMFRSVTMMSITIVALIVFAYAMYIIQKKVVMCIMIAGAIFSIVHLYQGILLIRAMKRERKRIQILLDLIDYSIDKFGYINTPQE